MYRQFLAAFAAMSAFATIANAASVEPTQGQVLINRGDGYKGLSGPTSGQPGDTVMANAGGSAVITYEDGCKVTVDPGAVVAIEAKSPCDGVTTTTFAIGGAVLAGAVGGAILLFENNDNKPASP